MAKKNVNYKKPYIILEHILNKSINESTNEPWTSSFMSPYEPSTLKLKLGSFNLAHLTNELERDLINPSFEPFTSGFVHLHFLLSFRVKNQ